MAPPPPLVPGTAQLVCGSSIPPPSSHCFNSGVQPDLPSPWRGSTGGLLGHPGEARRCLSEHSPSLPLHPPTHHPVPSWTQEHPRKPAMSSCVIKGKTALQLPGASQNLSHEYLHRSPGQFYSLPGGERQGPGWSFPQLLNATNRKSCAEDKIKLSRLRKGKETGTSRPRRAGQAPQHEEGAGSSQLHLWPHILHCNSLESTMEERSGEGCFFRRGQEQAAVAARA